MVNIIEKGGLTIDKKGSEHFLIIELLPDDFKLFEAFLDNQEAEDPDRGCYIELRNALEAFMDDIGIVVTERRPKNG